MFAVSGKIVHKIDFVVKLGIFKPNLAPKDKAVSSKQPGHGQPLSLSTFQIFLLQ